MEISKKTYPNPLRKESDTLVIISRSMFQHCHWLKKWVLPYCNQSYGSTNPNYPSLIREVFLYVIYGLPRSDTVVTMMIAYGIYVVTGNIHFSQSSVSKQLTERETSATKEVICHITWYNVCIRIYIYIYIYIYITMDVDWHCSYCWREIWNNNLNQNALKQHAFRYSKRGILHIGIHSNHMPD